MNLLELFNNCSSLLKNYLSKTHHFIQQHAIKLNFIPSRAPHFGCFWECVVIRDQLLTLEKCSTLVVRVEVMLNSRPLTPQSADPSKLEAMTLGHFILGKPIVSLSEACNMHISGNILRRWQLVNSSHNTFNQDGKRNICIHCSNEESG